MTKKKLLMRLLSHSCLRAFLGESQMLTKLDGFMMYVNMGWTFSARLISFSIKYESLSTTNEKETYFLYN